MWIGFNVARAGADELDQALLGQRTMAHLERFALGDVAALHLQSHAGSLPLSGAVETSLVLTYLSFFALPVVTAVIALRATLVRRRLIVTATALCLAAGVACFSLLPTEPPWHVEPSTVERIAPRVVADLVGSDARFGGGDDAHRG